MSALRSAIARAATAGAIVASAFVVPDAQTLAPAPDPFGRFRQNLTAYLVLKAHVQRTEPPRAAARSFEEYTAATDRLRMAIARARRDARAGSIFTVEVRPILRSLIDHTLDEHGIDVRELLVDLRLDRPRDAASLRINEPYPPDRRVLMVPCLLESLPALPRGLDYRLDGRDLILLDVDVNLVLDVLPNALAASPVVQR
jgi:hypothetical protein